MNIEDLIEEINGILEDLSIDKKGKIIERTLASLMDYLGVNEDELLEYYNYYTIIDCVIELITNKHILNSSKGIKSHSTGNTSITFRDISDKASELSLYPIIRGWNV